MKTGCVINLAIYTALVMAYHHWLSVTLDPPAVWIVSCVMGLIVVGVIGAWYNSRAAARDAGALRRAQAGAPPADRAWSGVIGTIEPVEETLAAPFSGKPCVICEYEIVRIADVADSGSGRTRSQRVADFSGIAMAACGIRTGTELVGLYGFPNLDEIPHESFDTAAGRNRAVQYVRSTEWTDCTGLKVFGGARQMWSALTEALPSFRHDWRNVDLAKCGWLNQTASPDEPAAHRDDDEDDDDADDDDIDDEHDTTDDDDAEPGDSRDWPMLFEKRIAPGEPVAAVGKYFADSNALVSTAADSGQMIHLFRGDVGKVIAELSASKRRRFWGGLIALIITHGMLWLGLTLYRSNEQTQKEWGDQLRKAVEAGDLPTIERMLARGLPPDAPVTPDGETALMRAENPAVIRLLVERGANVDATDTEGSTALMRAAGNNRPDVLQALIEQGADLNLRNTTYGSTALIRALGAENYECAEILRKAGAADDTVSEADGTPITEQHDAFAACREYVAAIHAANPARLAELSSTRRNVTFTDVDWDVWRNTRPLEPKLVRGCIRGDDATVILTGMTPKGFETPWNFQLARENGRWRIVRENWLTKGIPPE
jgi:hypothetical protein